MAELDNVWNDLLRDVMENGVDKGDRTDTGTRSVFGRQVRFDVSKDSFPIITEKKIHWNSLITELVWFIKGKTNVEFLHEHGVGIWDQWADENGDVGPVYGKQWRKWEGPNGEKHDQLKTVIRNIRDNPDSRRHVVSAWNVAELDRMGLPPCHFAYQFYSKPTASGRGLSVKVNQRSADAALGVPFNFSSYAILLILISHLTDHKPGEVIWSGGDVHIYQNHFDQVKRFLELDQYKEPKIELDETVSSLDGIDVSTVDLVGYEHGPFIKLPVAV